MEIIAGLAIGTVFLVGILLSMFLYIRDLESQVKSLDEYANKIALALNILTVAVSKKQYGIEDFEGDREDDYDLN